MASPEPANGVHDLVGRARTRRERWSLRSPASRRCNRPSTGIVDSHALMLALQGDLENAGGLVALQHTCHNACCHA